MMEILPLLVAALLHVTVVTAVLTDDPAHTARRTLRELLHAPTTAVDNDNGSCGTYQVGICRPNGKLVAKLTNVTELSRCCQECLARPKCATWILNSERSECYMRQSAGTTVGGSQCTSGLLAQRTKSSVTVTAKKHKMKPATPKGSDADLKGVVTDTSKPIVCFNNLARNDRTAAIFETGFLNRFQSPYQFFMTASEAFGYKEYAKIAIPRSKCTYVINLVYVQHLTSSKCTKKTPCIVTGDEFCSFKEKNNKNVVARQYFSTKYKIPAISLGPGVAFNVTESQAKDSKPPRKFLFSFVGSLGHNKAKTDRKHFQKVIETFTANGTNVWGQKSHINFTPWLKINMAASTAGGKFSTQVSTYEDVVLHSTFTLNPVGDHDECFRFWEALQAGSIPIIAQRVVGVHKVHGGREEVTTDKAKWTCPGAMDNVLATNPPIVILDSWGDFPAFIESVTDQQIQALYSRISSWNQEWWQNQTDIISNIVSKMPKYND